MTRDILAKNILEKVGGIENILTLENCMTRVRITPKSDDNLDIAGIKSLEGVMGAIKQGSQLQIIVGPGVASEVKNAMQAIIDASPSLSTSNNASTSNSGKEMEDIKAVMKSKYEVSFAGVLKTVANIFIPLIPAFIACGLLAGIANILTNPSISGDFAQNYPHFTSILKVFGSSIFFVMMVFVGVTTAQVFGGSIALGAALAGILTHPGLSNITLFGEQLSPIRGGVISVILVVYLACILEKELKKRIKGSLDLILNPLLVITIMGFAALVILQPIAGFIADYIGKAATIAVDGGGAITGFILAGAFLPLVMTGLHQALIPIHTQLIQDTGVTVLFPILAMAGAGQVGASFAVLLKTKNERLKKITKSALPVGLLGIGEPLIYGVTLPLGKPFITACIGGAFGGGVLAFFKVGSLSIGISGLPLALSVGQGMILHYLFGLFTAYSVGFLLTYVVGFKDLEN